MKLFLSPGACSLSPHIILEESGLHYETEVVNLKTKVTAGGDDFWAINSKGYVPALLLDDGQLLTEGPAIVQFIADQVPEKKLVPANGTVERYVLQSWLTFIGTELHKSFGPFFYPGASDEWKTMVFANLERRLSYVNEQLEGKSYLMGENFGAADAYLFTVLSWSTFAKLDLNKWPNILAYQGRVAVRPAVQAALKAEGLV